MTASFICYVHFSFFFFSFLFCINNNFKLDIDKTFENITAYVFLRVFGSSLLWQKNMHICTCVRDKRGDLIPISYSHIPFAPPACFPPSVLEFASDFRIAATPPALSHCSCSAASQCDTSSASIGPPPPWPGSVLGPAGPRSSSGPARPCDS